MCLLSVWLQCRGLRSQRGPDMLLQTSISIFFKNLMNHPEIRKLFNCWYLCFESQKINWGFWLIFFQIRDAKMLRMFWIIVEMNYLDSILIDEKCREPINPLSVTQLSETNIWIKKGSRLEYFQDKTLCLIFDKHDKYPTLA